MPTRGFANTLVFCAVVCSFGTGVHGQSSVPDRTLQPRITLSGPALEFDFEAVHIGTAEYDEGPTGATVLYFPSRVVAAVDVRGGSPGTSGTDTLRFGYDTPLVDAIVLAGGSSYGLEAVEGVRGELLSTGKRDTSRFNIANVLGAIIYDFPYRANSVYADKELGRAAYRAARPGRFPLGARGAGRSASVGKYFGFRYGEQAGQGAAFRQVGKTKLLVVTVVNALGNIVDRQGRVVRGNRDPESGVRTHIYDDLHSGAGARKRDAESKRSEMPAGANALSNTTLTVVVTNQKLLYWELQRLAVQVHTSMARSIQPFQTRRDGDVLFAVTTAEVGNAALDAADLATAASELAWDAVLASVQP
jgi:L-aminopeptidase/D-esterase-like protein